MYSFSTLTLLARYSAATFAVAELRPLALTGGGYGYSSPYTQAATVRTRLRAGVSSSLDARHLAAMS